MEDLFPDPYEVLYEDQELLIVNKSAPLPSTGLQWHDPYCLQSILMDDFQQNLWAIHQLDAETSGVIAFCKMPSQIERIKGFMNHPLSRKVYLAICHGLFPYELAYIHLPIAPSGSFNHFQVAPHGKKSITWVKKLLTWDSFSLLAVRIETGRTHQIRVHLSEVGFPLLGDQKYNPASADDFHRHALHASVLYLEPLSLLLQAPLKKDLYQQIPLTSLEWDALQKTKWWDEWDLEDAQILKALSTLQKPSFANTIDS